MTHGFLASAPVGQLADRFPVVDVLNLFFWPIDRLDRPGLRLLLPDTVQTDYNPPWGVKSAGVTADQQVDRRENLIFPLTTPTVADSAVETGNMSIEQPEVVSAC